MTRTRREVLALLLLLTACSPTRGCIEPDFDLAPESRLPKWFASAGITRADATVTMDYWVGPVGRTATFTLRDRQGHRVARVVGKLRGNEPLSLVPHGRTGRIPYPSYEVITANGITEVIEHRRMEPIFYITDDRTVRRKLFVDPWP